jgi:hypothetical protein
MPIELQKIAKTTVYQGGS